MNPFDKRNKPGMKLSLDEAAFFLAPWLVLSIPISTFFTNLVMALILVFWMFGGDYQKKMMLFWQHPISRMILLLFLLITFGLFYSNGTMSERIDGYKDALRLLCLPVLFYYFSREKTARDGLLFFIAAMVLTMVLSYLKFYCNLPIGEGYSAAAVFKSHIKTNFFMAVSAFMIALYLLNQKWLSSWKQWALGAIFLLMVFDIFFMSEGRSGYLVFAFLMLVVAYQKLRLKGMITAIIAIFALGILAYQFSPTFHNRIEQIPNEIKSYQDVSKLNDSSIGARLDFAINSIALIEQKPFLGWGTGSFESAYQLQMNKETSILTKNPHNEYFRIAVELGIIGLGAFLLIFLRMLQLNYLHNHSRNRGKYTLIVGVVGAFMIGCLANSWLMDYTEGAFFIVMSAVLFAAIPLKQESNLSQEFAKVGRVG